MNSLLVMCLVLRGFANDPHPEDKAFYCSKPTTQTELAAHIVPDPSFGRHILFELHPHLAALSTKPKATGSLDVFNNPNAVPEKGRVIVCYDNIRLAPHATGPMPASSCPGTAAFSEDRAAAWIAAEKAKQPPEKANFVAYDLVRVKQ